MKVAVDRNRCGGMGRCEFIAPRFFEVGADGVVLVLADRVPPEKMDTVAAAVEGCPTEALSLVEES